MIDEEQKRAHEKHQCQVNVLQSIEIGSHEGQFGELLGAMARVQNKNPCQIYGTSKPKMTKLQEG